MPQSSHALLLSLAQGSASANAAGWNFVQNGTASNDPLVINNASARGALWNLETNTASPLRVISDTFCASGGFLSNGTMVTRTTIYPLFLHMIVGGIHERTPFYNNTDPVNNFEFFPPKDGGVPRPSEFLARSLPANLFPRVFGLPDGRVLMVANNQTIIYDLEKNTKTILPDIPNGVRVTNPFDGSATLLPLSPPLYTPEVLVCGGTTASDLIQPANLSSQDPASDHCSRLTITPEGIKKGWQVEKMLEARIMPELLLLPNGQVLTVDGAQTGYAAFDTVPDPVGFQSNADHPAFTPSLYTPELPLSQRISNKVMPTTNIPRVYHSVASLMPQGNILIAGSNPLNGQVVNGTGEFHTYRSVMSNVPAKIRFNKRFTINVSIPKNLKANSIEVALMDLGFSSHAFHSSSRLVFMDAHLSPDRKTLSILSPPNNRVYPPGPAHIFVTIDDVTRAGAQVMVGSGAPPPVADQGLPNQF
ncbi:hypothetical protein BDZ97DRAFT_1904260 [Flammula alnicola]|nr:hypothetical protein BDZ97DRAFT_1904260 [Flammula alnicola]